MKQEQNFWVVGGDMRQVMLAQQLKKDGHCVHTFALEQAAASIPHIPLVPSLQGIERADCVIFPLPVSSSPDMLHTPLSSSQHSLSGFLDRLSPEQFLCGGRIDEDTYDRFHVRELTIHDYFAREELAIANAIPTAEGAIQLAMEALPITIHGAQVLVIGYGRVGKVTAQRFAALGARVTVCARSYDQLAWAQTVGHDTVHLNRITDRLCSCDLVINTVPARVLHGTQLRRLKADCPIIELASHPGGTDPEAARQLGQRIIPAPALPGKVAPVTAGVAIRNAIYHLLQELDEHPSGKDDFLET